MGPYSESPADELAALRGAITAYLDADHRVDPGATLAAKRRLRALVGWTPPDDRRVSAARRRGLGGEG